MLTTKPSMDLKDVIAKKETQDIMTYETNPTNDVRDDDMDMSETGQKGNTYEIDDDATLSQHGMEIQIHKAYRKKPDKFAAR